MARGELQFFVPGVDLELFGSSRSKRVGLWRRHTFAVCDPDVFPPKEDAGVISFFACGHLESIDR